MEDKQKVLDLLESRAGRLSKYSDESINPLWVERVMMDDETYIPKPDCGYRLFGLFEDDFLDCIVINRILGKHEKLTAYTVTNFVSNKNRKTPPVMKDGYGVNSTLINDFGHSEMRKEGFYEYYAMTPYHKDWRQFEDNPNRPKYYTYIDVEIISAGEVTNVPFHKYMMSRPFSVDVVIRKAIPNWNVINDINNSVYNQGTE